MKRSVAAILLCSLALGVTARTAHAQAAGSVTLGIAGDELKIVALGWSAKRQILGKSVHNDDGKKIGSIDDLIVAPDRSISYAIIGVGGFLGLRKHDVAIPVSQLKRDGHKLVLPGATKDALKALPEFHYAKPA